MAEIAKLEARAAAGEAVERCRLDDVAGLGAVAADAGGVADLLERDPAPEVKAERDETGRLPF